MKITLERPDAGYTLHSYRDGTIHIRPPNAPLQDDDALLQIKGSCLLSAGQLFEEWAPQQLVELTAAHLQPIAQLQPEVLLIGTGPTMQMPTTEQRIALVRLGIGHEVMDTAAACRTYNVLVAEGRRVVAALFAN